VGLTPDEVGRGMISPRGEYRLKEGRKGDPPLLDTTGWPLGLRHRVRQCIPGPLSL
jgi:hypothetical protein